MTSPTKNTAAFVVTQPKRHIEVREAPYTRPGPGQLVVRNRAVAINPIDCILPITGGFQHLKWPFVLGSDSAGEVVEIGPNVTRFHVGDRVVGQAIGYDAKVNTSAESSFQLYTVLREDMTTRVPDRLSYEQACVLPLGTGTAACALFQPDFMALELPTTRTEPRSRGVVIVWGGSTSVGSCATQLATAAGYEVITTCSPHNFEYCKGLGAVKCFDYKSAAINQEIIHFMNGKTLAGAMSIGDGGVEACLDIFNFCKGNKFIAAIAFPKPNNPQRFVAAQTIFSFLKFMIVTAVRSWRGGVRWGFVNGTTLAFNGVGKSIYAGYLGQALEDGTFQCAPSPMVAGHGLDKLQTACDTQQRGVSAAKVVVTL